MTDIFVEDGKLKARLGIADHPEFPDETSKSYFVPREQFDAVVEENERLRAELANYRPAWSKAPEWVNYRIISPHGHLLWCESIPEKADYLRDIPQTRMVSIFCKEPIIEERPK